MADIKIYGVLHAATGDAVIARAAQVLDATLGKKQGEINENLAAGKILKNGQWVNNVPEVAGSGSDGLMSADDKETLDRLGSCIAEVTVQAGESWSDVIAQSNIAANQNVSMIVVRDPNGTIVKGIYTVTQSFSTYTDMLSHTTKTECVQVDLQTCRKRVGTVSGDTVSFGEWTYIDDEMSAVVDNVGQMQLGNLMVNDSEWKAALEPDEANGIIKVNKADGSQYVLPLVKYEKPADVTFAPQPDYSTTDSRVSIAYSGVPKGGEVYYTTDGSDPATSDTRVQGNGSVVLSVDQSTYSTTHNIVIKVKLNGLWSDGVSKKVITYRKLGAVAIAASGNDYSASRTITLTKPVNDAAVTVKYTTDGSDPKTSDTAQTYSSPFTLSADATVKAYAYSTSDYMAKDSDLSQKSFVVGYPTMKYGFHIVKTMTADSIKALAGSKETRNPAGQYTAKNNVTGYYMWFCVASQQNINKVTSGGFDVPLEAAVTVGKYKCYRSSNAVAAGEHTFVVA